MGQLASAGKLPSTVLRKQGSTKVQEQGRGGGKSIPCGRPGYGKRRPRAARRPPAPPGAHTQLRRVHLEATRSDQARSAPGKKFRPLLRAVARRLSWKWPPAPGPLAWEQAGACQAGECPGGCSWTAPPKGPFVPPRWPDGGHLLPGCDLHPILRQLAVGPRPGWVTCPSPISSFPNQAEGGGGRLVVTSLGQSQAHLGWNPSS